MLRAAVKEGTEFGLRAKEVMDAGGLVSDEIMIGVVDERLHQTDTTRRGYVLDGFPRTVPPGRGARPHRRRAPAARGRSTSRCPSRWSSSASPAAAQCVDCGAIYSVKEPPKYPWHCDNCGGDVVQRDDDTEEAIRRRLDLYAAGDRAAHRVLREAVAAGRGRRARRHRRGLGPAAGRDRRARSLTRLMFLHHGRSRSARPTSSAAMRRAGRVVAEMHERIRAAIRPGVTDRRPRPDRPGGAGPPRRDARTSSATTATRR